MTEKYKTEYKNFQIPKNIIDNALVIMHYFGYRTPHELVIEAVRRHVERLTNLNYKLEELKSEAKHMKDK